MKHPYQGDRNARKDEPAGRQGFSGREAEDVDASTRPGPERATGDEYAERYRRAGDRRR